MEATTEPEDIPLTTYSISVRDLVARLWLPAFVVLLLLLGNLRAALLTAAVAQVPLLVLMTTRIEGDPLGRAWRQSAGAPAQSAPPGSARRALRLKHSTHSADLNKDNTQ